MAKIFVNGEGNFEKDPLPSIPAEDLLLIDGLKTYILSIYKPAQNAVDADKRMSTAELYEAFCRIYHNELFFTKNDMAKWLKAEGFTIWDAGGLRFEWLLKSLE